MKKKKDIFGWVVTGAILIVAVFLVGLAFYAMAQEQKQEQICGGLSAWAEEDNCPYYKCKIEILNSSHLYDHTRYQTCILREQQEVKE